jgi:DNA invertase Pin-like site-specific DNA recombinase
LLNVLESLQHFGVDLVCTDQEIDTKSPAGRLLFTILGAVSELELDLIRERTKDGLARARAQGKRIGRPAPPPLPNPARTDEILRLRQEGFEPFGKSGNGSGSVIKGSSRGSAGQVTERIGKPTMCPDNLSDASEIETTDSGDKFTLSFPNVRVR